MTPEETFGQRLGIAKAWRVAEARLEASSSAFVLEVKATEALWPEDSARAGTPMTCHDNVEPMQWRPLNVFNNKERLIGCGLLRGRHGNDGKVHRLTPPWEGRSKPFTQEVKAFAVALIREIPVKRVGQILGESDTRAWRMLFAHAKAAYERLSFDTVVWVGADEMNRHKGNNYLPVFPVLVAERDLFATSGKNASAWEAFAEELLRHNGHPKAIQHVAIAMDAAYAKGVSESPENTRVVYDKFHVIQNVVQAGDQVRKDENRTDIGKQNQLERTRRMWLKNWVNWTEKATQKWESMPLKRRVTGFGYEIKLVLQGTYKWKYVEIVKKLLGNRCAWVKAIGEQTEELTAPMVQVARMIEDHFQRISAIWNRGLTTALMVGLNSICSTVKRQARGYRTVEYMTAIFYIVVRKLTLPP